MMDQQQYYNTIQANTKQQITSAIKELIDIEEDCKVMLFHLTGKRKKRDLETGEIIIIEEHKPFVNDEGAQRIVSLYRNTVNSNIVLTYLKEDEIRKRCDIFHSNIIFFIHQNIINYNIPEVGDVNGLIIMIDNMFKAALSRAYNGMTLHTTTKNIQIVEHRDLDDNQSKKNILGGIFKK